MPVALSPPPALTAPLAGIGSLDGPSDVGQALRRLVDSGALHLPLPGSGATVQRFAALAEVAAVDLSLGRLTEGHADALAILDELGSDVAVGGAWGVWAADPPDARVSAHRVGDKWRLQGTKRYCSGATTLDRALVTAFAPHGMLLFTVDLAADGVRPVPARWSAVGMADSDSLDVEFDVEVDSIAIGATRAYLDRPGFWHGSVGVAACWYGGALGTARFLAARLAKGADEHALAHLGAVAAVLGGMARSLTAAASAIDADPLDELGDGRVRALGVRHLVEAGATEVLARTGRATGSGPMVHDRTQARRAADLPVYLRQSHAEADLAILGRSVLEEGRWP